LDNERLLITSIAKGANPNVFPPDARIVVLNMRDRQVRVIAEKAVDLPVPGQPRSPYLPCEYGRVLCETLNRKEDGYLYVDQTSYESKVQQGRVWLSPSKKGKCATAPSMARCC
jgi:hypothetical protein